MRTPKAVDFFDGFFHAKRNLRQDYNCQLQNVLFMKHPVASFSPVIYGKIKVPKGDAIMINKIHFAKRMSQLRHRTGLSQTELAKRLGVTSQAVSKWERGTAIPDIETLLELSHLYNISVNGLLEDRDFLFELTGHPTSNDKIAYFVPKQERPYNVQWADQIRSGNWIKRNWENTQSDRTVLDEVGKNIASCGGIILEIGAGPGGGFMPYVLKAEPDSTIIISDLSPTVVSEWKRFLDKTFHSPNLCYAVFDFCCMPFKDNSIDVVSDGGRYR